MSFFVSRTYNDNPQSGIGKIKQFLCLVLLLFGASFTLAQSGVNYPVATVSAASYEPNAAVAPVSVVASFGTNLATMTLAAMDTNPATPAIDLPTILGGTTVQVNNILCGLLYVSPTQINFVLPEGLGDGSYSVTISSSNNIASGAVSVSRVQPTIFALNGDAQGVLAASVVRVKADGSQQHESVAQLDDVTKRWLPKPINLGPVGERVFLEIYLTGIRQAQDENNDGNLNEHIFVLLGGKSITPAYAGRHGFFAGIDQVNVELPRTLIGKGKINLSIHGNVTTGPGFTSNAVELEIAPAKSNVPPTINSLSVSKANIGDLVVIYGAGFGSGFFDNVVTFGGIQGDVEFASSDMIVARVPYGAKTGKVKVVNAQGEAISTAEVQLRTSLSGIIESATQGLFFPLQNITVSIAGTNLSTTTNQAGAFILSDVPNGAVTLNIDPATNVFTKYFPKTSLKVMVEAGRDNPLPATIGLDATNTTGLVNSSKGTEWNALTGLLTDTDGVTPVPNALVRLLGKGTLATQTIITDNNGSYVFRNVGSSDVIAETRRANGTVLKVSGTINFSVARGKANGVGVLDLSLKNAPANHKPVIIAPATAALKVNETLDVPLYISDPDANDTFQVSANGLQNASLLAGTDGNYTLRLNPVTAGVFTLELKAVDAQGNQTTSTMTVTVTPNIKKLPVPAAVNSVAFDSSAIYIGTTGSGIMRSTDGGLSWQEANSGIVFNKYAVNKKIVSVFANGETLYAATDTEDQIWDGTKFITNGGGVFISTDQSSSWAKTRGAHPQTRYDNYGFGKLAFFNDQLQVSFYGHLSYYLSDDLINNYLVFGEVSSCYEKNGELYLGLLGRYVDYEYSPIPIFTTFIKLKKDRTKVPLIPLRSSDGNLTPILGVSGLGSVIIVVTGKLAVTNDDNISWQNLDIPELTDNSAKAITTLGNKLVVSYSKGVLVSTNPQQEWKAIPLNLDGRLIKEMYTKGAALFCITTDGALYQISGI